MFLVLCGAGAVSDAAAGAVESLAGSVVSGRHRLGPDAVEWRVSDAACLPALRDWASAQGMDANIVAAQGRQKQVLVADMDSTIIPVECIDEIADVAGVGPQVAAITEAAMRGELVFEQALERRVGLLRGLPEAALNRVLAERISLNPGARTLVQTMRAMGATTALISGGFTWFTSRVAEMAGFEVHRANTLLLENGLLTGKVGLPILGRAAKLAGLQELTAARGLTTDAALAIGDGANDLDMIRAAGLGIAYRAKPAVAAAAGVRLDHAPLTAALYLQGVPYAAFKQL